jgi:penicillin-binding protein 1A
MRYLYQLFLTLLTLFLTLALISVITITATFYILQPQLPDIDSLKDVQLQVPLRIYTAERQLIAEYGEKKREPLPFEAFPKQLIQAIIASEDENFFTHPGVDYKGILRAVVNLLKTGERGQGGSTITMQVARNFFLSSEKTYIRKIKEIFLSINIERKLSKQEIMALYLNKIYLGQRAYGAAAAAKVYYGKPVQQLSLNQFAMIAGLPKAPSSYNPVTNKKRATSRRNYVLKRMLDLDFISNRQYRTALTRADEAKLYRPDIEVDAPYVAEMVRAYMIAQYADKAYIGGYNVFTSIKGPLQTAANKALRAALMEYEHRHGYKGVLAQHNLQTSQTLDEQQVYLKEFAKVGHLQPALVISIDEKTNNGKILLQDGSSPVLKWKHIQWARKYISDNYMGPKLKKISDVIQPGDVIYVEQLEVINSNHTDKDKDNSNDKRSISKEYALAQIPEVAGALVCLNPQNGGILALTGGFDYFHSKFNRVVQAKRQPGSNFKPFVYSAALNKGYTPATLINDAPVVFKDSYLEGYWRPDNSSGKFFGPTRLRQGLIKSRNLVSIRILRDIGIDYTIDYDRRFGFSADELPANLSLALGSATLTPMQIAKGYAILANGGFDITPWFIDTIEDPKENILFQQQHKSVCSKDYSTESCNKDMNHYAERVVDEDNAFLMTSFMQDVIKYGTGKKALQLKRKDLAGKTGTTNDQLDAWFSGFNRQLVTTAWVGFDRPRSLGRREYGAAAALPMWMKFMQVALKDMPEVPLRVPESIITVKIDRQTGMLASASSKATLFEYFVEGTEPVKSPGGNFLGSGTQKEKQTVNEELF